MASLLLVSQLMKLSVTAYLMAKEQEYKEEISSNILFQDTHLVS